MKKLSPSAKLLLLKADLRSRPESPLQVLLKTQKPIETEERQRLEEAGARIRTVAGDVVTASLSQSHLEGVMSLDFVEYVDISRELHPEASSEETRRLGNAQEDSPHEDWSAEEREGL